MKITLFFFILISSLFGDYCFKDKSANETICYEKYFQRDNIYKAKSDETYYTSKKGIIYAIGDKIEIKFDAIGAIISLEKDFEIDFYDKLKNDTYIFKVRNPYELFSILSNLNRLDAIQKAVPAQTRKYTQTEVQRRIEERKSRLQKVMEKEKMREEQKATMGSSGTDGPKNFLKGQH
jgi:hypothetical protein